MRRGDAVDRLDVGSFSPALNVWRKAIAYGVVKSAKIGELISSIRYGTGTPPPRVEPSSESVPFLRATDIKDGQVLLDALPHISADQPKKMDKCKLSGGELVIVRSGVNTGDCAVVPVQLRGAYAAYDLIVETKSQVTSEFVCACLYTSFGKSQIDTVKNRAAQPHINAEEVKAFEIPLPPIDVQRRLVAELDAVRAERDRALAEAERLLTSIDVYVLAELSILPQADGLRVFAVRLNQVKPRLDADYHSPYFQRLRRAIEQSKHATRNLGDLAVFMRSGFAAGRQDQARGDEAAVPHLRPLNLNAWGELSIAETKSVPASRVKEGDYLEKGEILFNNTNSAEWVGKTAVFELVTPCACSNHMTRIALKPGIEPHFVAALLNAFRGIGYFSALSTFFNNQAGINTRTLAELRVPVPDADTQQTIACEVVNRKDKARLLQGRAETIWRDARERFEQQLLQGGKT